MKPYLETKNGWTEAILDDDCGFEKFYLVADILSDHFGVLFSNKVNDFDSLYWHFEYKSELILHYNTFLGVSIYPGAAQSATERDNEAVVEISALVLQKLADFDWSDFENGNTIGTKGSENGTILLDIENPNGARITLEKECGNIPFAITSGIYGLMVHTHFEKDLEQAREYVSLAKFRINKIIDLYNVPEEKRDDYWHTKHDMKVNELAEMPLKTEGEIKNTSPGKVLKWWRKFFFINF